MAPWNGHENRRTTLSTAQGYKGPIHQLAAQSAPDKTVRREPEKVVVVKRKCGSTKVDVESSTAGD